jgi:phospholipase C
MATDPIKHVVVLMLENRSFDHILGAMRQVYPTLEGIDLAKPATNSWQGRLYPQIPGAARSGVTDPKHDYANVLGQISNNNGEFVANYSLNEPNLSSAQLSEVMRYHDRGALPALHLLDENFAVCDHWFASVPGPTWPNRLFAMSGTSLGRVKMPEGTMPTDLHWYDQDTIFDRLNERSIPWKVYFGDFPLSLLLVHQREPRNVFLHRKMAEFREDAAGPENKFPSFAWIEPAYLPPLPNDDHPSHDVWNGEALIASVYNALRANRDLWNSTLLVVLFDEHGGFYDHVGVQPAVPPDHFQYPDEGSFFLTGLRVPALLVSPYVQPGVLPDIFDHTSLLKYLIDKWQLGGLYNRTAAARTFAAAIGIQVRTNTPPQIMLPSTPAPPVPLTRLGSNHNAMLALSHLLETMTDEDSATVAARSRQILSSPQSRLDVIFDRAEAFIRQQSARFLSQQ